MGDHQSSHGIHRRMPEHAARVRLDRHPGPHDRVRVAELADDTVGIEALTVTEGLEKAPRRIESIPASCEAPHGKLGRDHPVLRRPTHVQRLGHRPEVHAYAGGRARRDGERVRDLGAIETKQPGRGDDRAERANGAGRVEALHVVAGTDGLGNLALHLEAREKRIEERRAGRMLPLADGQRCDHRRHGRVRQQSEDTVGAGRQLRVVPVQRMAARPVEQRRRGRTAPERLGAERGGLRLRVNCLNVAAQDTAGVLRRSGQHDAESVDDASLCDPDGLRRKIPPAGPADEIHDRARGALLVAHATLLRSPYNRLKRARTV